MQRRRGRFPFFPKIYVPIESDYLILPRRFNEFLAGVLFLARAGYICFPHNSTETRDTDIHRAWYSMVLLNKKSRDGRGAGGKQLVNLQ